MTWSRELRTNYSAFRDRWRENRDLVSRAIEERDDVFFHSYRRILSLQAWRSELLESLLAPAAISFVLEAQNDALTSHILAQSGMWRPSLQALRSCIENTLQALYYKDHLVELRLWESGRQRLTFSELHKYLLEHPDRPAQAHLAGLEQLSSEYSVLSRAVHASAASFRMAADANVRFFTSEQASVGAWETRERRTVAALNTVLLWMFREYLIGARLPNLRRVVAYSVAPTQRAEVRQHLRITLPTPT